MLRERMRALGREAEYVCPALPTSPRAAVDLAYQLASAPIDEIAIVGDPGEPETRTLLEVATVRFRPAQVVAVSAGPDESA